MAGGEFAVRRGELVRAATQPVAVASQGAQSPSWGLEVKPIAVAVNGRTASNCNSSFGNATIVNFQPATDVIEIDHAVFATVQALLAATHDNGHGSAVITADAHDTITLKDVSLAQLEAHLSGFHII